jgi:hypothetical protein
MVWPVFLGFRARPQRPSRNDGKVFRTLLGKCWTERQLPLCRNGLARRLSGGDRGQVSAGGIVQDAMVSRHQRGILHPRGGYDQPVSRIAVKCLGE